MKLDREAPDYKIKQGIALQEGVRRLMEFGKDVTNYDRYIERLLGIFKGQQIEIQ
jgi:hypothetical protein